MKKLLPLLVGLIGLTSVVKSQDLTTLVEKTAPAIFKITTYDATGAELAMGTGFFIDATGTALTNYHVMQGAVKAKVTLDSNKTFWINNVIAWSRESDLVKFGVDGQQTRFVFLKQSTSAPKPGERVFTIGNPMGLDKSVSDGIVSSVRRDDTYGESIQVTVPISQGNSGSPLMNINGEFVGVVTYYLQQGQNLNFAVSAKNLAAMIPVNALTFPIAESTATPLPYGGASAGYDNDKTTSADSYYYKRSKVEFGTALDANQRLVQSGKTFYAPSTGGSLYAVVSTNQSLATNELVVDVYRRNGRRYNEFVETKCYAVEPDWTVTHFKYNFPKPGRYRVSVYNANDAWINTTYVRVKNSR